LLLLYREFFVNSGDRVIAKRENATKYLITRKRRDYSCSDFRRRTATSTARNIHVNSTYVQLWVMGARWRCIAACWCSKNTLRRQPAVPLYMYY